MVYISTAQVFGSQNLFRVFLGSSTFLQNLFAENWFFLYHKNGCIFSIYQDLLTKTGKHMQKCMYNNNCLRWLIGISLIWWDILHDNSDFNFKCKYRGTNFSTFKFHFLPQFLFDFNEIWTEAFPWDSLQLLCFVCQKSPKCLKNGYFNRKFCWDFKISTSDTNISKVFQHNRKQSTTSVANLLGIVHAKLQSFSLKTVGDN